MNEMTPLKAAENLENGIKNFEMNMPISAEECIRRDTIQFAASVLRRVASSELAEVVHAHWIPVKKECYDITDDDEYPQWEYCSNCKISQKFQQKYCPNCGALMDGKDDSNAQK